MFRKLLCKLGFHDWYRLFPFGSTEGDIVTTHSECRYCSHIGNLQHRPSKEIDEKELWWLNTTSSEKRN